MACSLRCRLDRRLTVRLPKREEPQNQCGEGQEGGRDRCSRHGRFEKVPFCVRLRRPHTAIVAREDGCVKTGGAPAPRAQKHDGRLATDAAPPSGNSASLPTGAALSVFWVNGLVGFAIYDLDAIGGAGFRRRYD